MEAAGDKNADVGFVLLHPRRHFGRHRVVSFERPAVEIFVARPAFGHASHLRRHLLSERGKPRGEGSDSVHSTSVGHPFIFRQRVIGQFLEKG